MWKPAVCYGWPIGPGDDWRSRLYAVAAQNVRRGHCRSQLSAAPGHHLDLAQRTSGCCGESSGPGFGAGGPRLVGSGALGLEGPAVILAA